MLLPWAARLLDGDGPAGRGSIEDESPSGGRPGAGRRASPAPGSSRSATTGSRPGPLGYRVGGQPGGPVGLVRERTPPCARACPRGPTSSTSKRSPARSAATAFYDHEALLLDQAAVQRGGRRSAGRAPLGRRPGADDRAQEGAGARPRQHALGRRRRRDRPARHRASARAPTARPSAPSRSTSRSWPTRGVVLAVASKNNPADAREPFEINADMHPEARRHRRLRDRAGSRRG